MKIIIPMAGLGVRFTDHGYTDPKPLICIKPQNLPVVEYVVKMFRPFDEFVFICNNTHLARTSMYRVLQNLCGLAVTVIGMESHKLGPVHTIQVAYNEIADDEEVIVAYCDGMVLWDFDKFIQFVHQTKADGCLITHTGFHPHTLSSTKMAFICEHDGKVLAVKEKASYTDYPQNEHASSGIYYFRRGDFLKKYFDQMVAENTHYNGEFYVTLAFNPMIQAGLNVRFYDTAYVAILGTPHEVENFEAWSTIVANPNIKSNDDLVALFNYWKGYWDNYVES